MGTQVDDREVNFVVAHPTCRIVTAGAMLSHSAGANDVRISCRAHTEATHAHHIRFWPHDGPTNIPNLASLCPRCHDLVHDHNWTITTPPDGHPKLRAPAHLRLPPNPPAPSTRYSEPELDLDRGTNIRILSTCACPPAPLTPRPPRTGSNPRRA